MCHRNGAGSASVSASPASAVASAYGQDLESQKPAYPLADGRLRVDAILRRMAGEKIYLG